MEDFRYQMTVDISGKTHSALISFLQKHGQTSADISAFVEEAITWRMLEREMAFVRHEMKDEIEPEAGTDHDQVHEHAVEVGEDGEIIDKDAFLRAQLEVEDRYAA